MEEGGAGAGRIEGDRTAGREGKEMTMQLERRKRRKRESGKGKMRWVAS